MHSTRLSGLWLALRCCGPRPAGLALKFHRPSHILVPRARRVNAVTFNRTKSARQSYARAAKCAEASTRSSLSSDLSQTCPSAARPLVSSYARLHAHLTLIITLSSALIHWERTSVLSRSPQRQTQSTQSLTSERDATPGPSRRAHPHPPPPHRAPTASATAERPTRRAPRPRHAAERQAAHREHARV